MRDSDKDIAAVRDGSSLAWAFYEPPIAGHGHEQVEVRLNASPEAVAGFVPPSGWTLDRIQWGDTLFLRRQQSLERAAIEEMLVDMMHFAASNDLGFHSWLQGPGLDE